MLQKLANLGLPVPRPAVGGAGREAGQELRAVAVARLGIALEAAQEKGAADAELIRYLLQQLTPSNT